MVRNWLDTVIETYDNGVVKLDELSAPTTLGYIFGGLAANAPNTRGVPGAASAASNLIFKVVVTPVPEPTAFLLASGSVAVIVVARRTETARLPDPAMLTRRNPVNVG
jgi:hypothetical protein